MELFSVSLRGFPVRVVIAPPHLPQWINPVSSVGPPTICDG
jgi:hypothetical protein